MTAQAQPIQTERNAFWRALGERAHAVNVDCWPEPPAHFVDDCWEFSRSGAAARFNIERLYEQLWRAQDFPERVTPRAAARRLALVRELTAALGGVSFKKYLDSLAQRASLEEQDKEEDRAAELAQLADEQARKLHIASLTLTPRLLAQRPFAARAPRRRLFCARRWRMRANPFSGRLNFQKSRQKMDEMIQTLTLRDFAALVHMSYDALRNNVRQVEGDPSRGELKLHYQTLPLFRFGKSWLARKQDVISILSPGVTSRRNPASRSRHISASVTGAEEGLERPC